MASAKVRAGEKKVSVLSRDELITLANGSPGKKRAKARRELEKRKISWA